MDKKLTKAMESFTVAMEQRLMQKKREGFSGWDDSCMTNLDLHERLHEKALKVLLDAQACDEGGKKDLVDIANFAMFLYYQIDN